MYFLTLFQPTIPIVLGPTGTILYTALLVILATVIAYQRYKSAESSQWQGTALAYEKELVVVRDRSARLERENTELVKASTELQAKTDLSSLERQNLEIDRRNQEVHERIVLGLNNLLENNATRYAQISAVLMENTVAVKALGERMANEFELHRGAFANMIRTLNERTRDDREPARDGK